MFASGPLRIELNQYYYPLSDWGVCSICSLIVMGYMSDATAVAVPGANLIPVHYSVVLTVSAL